MRGKMLRTILQYGDEMYELTADGQVPAAAIEQPPPVPQASLDIQALVISDVSARRELGIGRYGTPLQPNNGRDALLDAYQEALDLCCYLRQVLYERDGK